MIEFPEHRRRSEVSPGAVHIPDWFGPAGQRELLDACREWSEPPAGLRTVRTPGRGVMTVKQVCLGWHWYPYRYAEAVEDGDGAPVKPFPNWLGRLAREAVEDAYGDGPSAEEYDIAVINFYDGTAKMGMHRDKEEHSPHPVVSFSLGDTCVFRFGNTRSRSRPYTDIELRSGDLFVFGGPARLAYHGVTKVFPGTAPDQLGLKGRLNVTLRVSGFS